MRALRRPSAPPSPTAIPCNCMQWLAAGVSAVQLVFVPALSGVSDVVGRRGVIAGALILHGASVLTFAAAPTSLIWATVCDLVTSLGIVIIPLSQAIMIDVAA